MTFRTQLAHVKANCKKWSLWGRFLTPKLWSWSIWSWMLFSSFSSSRTWLFWIFFEKYQKKIKVFSKSQLYISAKFYSRESSNTSLTVHRPFRCLSKTWQPKIQFFKEKVFGSSKNSRKSRVCVARVKCENCRQNLSSSYRWLSAIRGGNKRSPSYQ